MAIDAAYAALAASVVVIAWAARRRLQRDGRRERGASDDSFMTKVVKVSLIVMLVAGGIVWLLDRADDGPPDSGSGEDAPHDAPRHPSVNHR